MILWQKMIKCDQKVSAGKQKGTRNIRWKLVHGGFYTDCSVKALTDKPSDGLSSSYIGGCQNYGPFLDPYYDTAPNI